MTTKPRIVSFLPSATEMVCALGLGDQLAGVTHECDYPAEAVGKPIVVRNVLPLESMSQAEIDAAVGQRMRDGLSLYQVDEALLQELAPDLILTQNLCQVCAPSGNEVSEVLKLLTKKPEILWLSPQSLEEIAANLRQLGEATGRIEEAEELIADGRARLERIVATTRELKHRPRVFCVEWLDPIYCSGHWIPEMVEIAGGVDALVRKGTDSVRIPWSDVVKWAPEVLIITPCGFNLETVIEQTPQLMNYPGWSDLPAVCNDRVFAVDANSYFARPGPRVVEGTELLAHLFHPDLFTWEGRASAFRRVNFTSALPSATPTPRLPEKKHRRKQSNHMTQQPGFSQAKQKTCSNCGASFTCGVSAESETCWCYELPHIPQVTANDDDCLCPRCMTEAIAKVSSSQTVAADRASAALSETAQVTDSEGTVLLPAMPEVEA